MEPITFVSWRWQPSVGYRSTFPKSTVYALREMIRRHYTKPHRFVCVTDEPDKLPGIETVPIWSEYAGLQSNMGSSYPSCYRRLKLFAPDAAETFGERMVSIDLDTVITGDITPLFDRPEDFVIWGESDFKTQAYNGSLWMLRAGTRTKVWTEFSESGPKLAAKAGSKGSDQGWMNYILGPREAMWTRKDGVYSFRKDIMKHGDGVLPADARLVCFHGKVDPWSYRAMQFEWVRTHYPQEVTA